MTSGARSANPLVPSSPRRLLIISLSLSLIVISLSPAQTALKGRVTDWNWNNVPYATCTLKKAGLTTQTRMDGFFDFVNASRVVFAGAAVKRGSLIKLNGTSLKFSVVAKSELVRIEFFSISGKILGKLGEKQYSTGDYTVDLSRLIPSASCGIVRVTVGSSSSVFRITCISGAFSKKAGFPLTLSSVYPARLRRSRLRQRQERAEGKGEGLESAATPSLMHTASAILDTLVITHFGYLTRYVPITTYETQMDSIQLEYEFRQLGDPAGMTRIPGGLFSMGSTKSGNESPVHDVFVSPFWMDTTEVTQGDYEAVMNIAPWNNYKGTSFVCTIAPEAPAVFQTWGDAALYCNVRSKHDGKDTVYAYSSIVGTPGDSCILLGIKIDYTKKGYRLPTEAEREYACRAGTRTNYYWGTSYDTATVSKYEWFFDNSGLVMHEVSKKSANQLHLYDMGGNAIEICNDFYSLSYPDTFAIDPIGIVDGINKVTRGRHNGSTPQDMRSSFRGEINEKERYINTGFRPILPYRP
jgi:sulfatase modifying factor 1